MEPDKLQGAPELPGSHKHTDAEQLEQAAPVGKQDKFTPLSPVQPRMPNAEGNTDEDRLNEYVEHPSDPDGVVQAEKIRAWQAEHPAAGQAGKPRKKRRGLRALVWLLVLAIIAGAAYGAYWYGTSLADKNTGKKPPASQAKKTDTTHNQATAPQAKTVPTKHYDSTIYTLGFDYPETWKVTDTASKLIVASPAVSLATVNGATVNGHVVVTVQNQQSTIAGYPASGAVEVLESQKLSYVQPTPVQRAATYVSYLSYAKANGLDTIFVTGDNGYVANQSVPMGDVVKGNPLISVTFESCTSDDCSTGTPTMLTLLASKWQGGTLDKQVTALFKSITLD
ncbi:MAG TPA: hypothetical protein VLF59_05930 [Candidatus Saccharimonadales bacterium]|nr:hypothetical protein [Candidatus Saccharimonadales bacterium]